MALSTIDTSSISGLGYGFKNRIINGAMVIDQRNAGASINPTNGQYSVDRWKCYQNVSGRYTIQQSSNAPTGFSKSLLVTSSAATSIATTDYNLLEQIIEVSNFSDLSWGTASASTVTISFWVKSSLTGTFGGSLRNADSTYNYPFSYAISVANTWEYKTVVVTGATSGSWNGASLTDGSVQVCWSLGTGATYSGTAGAWTVTANIFSTTGAVSVLATNAATWQITGVQLEKGTVATSFDWRPYTTELQLCQRYYLLLASGTTKAFAMGSYQTSTYIEGVVSFPVTMRSTPALEATSGTDYYGIYANGADRFDTLLSEYLNVNSATVYNNTQVSGTAGYGGWFFVNNANAKVAFASEL